MTDTPCSVDPAHGRADYGTSYGPLCAECYRARVARQVDNEGYRTTSLDGISRKMQRALFGIQPDGKRAHGAFPWWWCYGNQPIFVGGAVYEDSREAAHLVKGITEAQAARLSLAIELGEVAVGVLGLTARQVKRQRQKRRRRA